jgi:hypothetical protein
MLKQLSGCFLVAMAALSHADASGPASTFDDEIQIETFSALQVAAARCPRALDSTQTLHYEDVAIKGYAGPDELDALGESIYLGDRRHPGAFYYSAERQSFIGRRSGTVEIRIPGAFIGKVLSHLSAALTRDYARSLYFADLGHGHFFVPWEEYRTRVGPLSAFSQELYDVLLNLGNLMVIYHAAEQMLKVVDGQPVQHPPSRHYIDRRNVLGSFTDAPKTTYLPPEKGNLHNTQSELDGYRGYGGIEFTWNRNACFPVQAGARIVYVDLSFESPTLRHRPAESDP